MEHTIKITEVAKKLQLAVSTIYRYAKQGDIPCVKVGSRWRFMDAELDRFLTGENRGNPAQNGGTQC
jgi:excisionase family DNA binding protein